MSRLLVLLYGCFAYGCFFLTILYAIGFVSGLIVPKSMNSGEPGPLGLSILINASLLGLFAVQHMIMARPGFKQRWTKIIPGVMERSTFVLATCACFGLLFWQWQPLPGVIWDLQSPVLRAVLLGISLLGWGIVLFSSFLIDHFELFGLRQVVLHFLGREDRKAPFVERSLYKWVRHPLMTGFLLAFWFTPTMTTGHLLFAALTTAYIIIGTQIEERDLIRAHGDEYRAYRRRTPAFIPIPKSYRPAPATMNGVLGEGTRG